jgi:hypothetical protein
MQAITSEAGVRDSATIGVKHGMPLAAGIYREAHGDFSIICGF